MRWPTPPLLIILCVLLFVLGCEEEKEKKGSTATTTTTIVPISIPPQDPGTYVSDLGETTSFTIPENTVSFLVSGFGDESSTRGIETLLDPSGNNIFPNDFQLPANGYGNVLNPITPTMETTAGNWSFTAFPGTTSFKLTYRVSEDVDSSTLTVKPYLTGSTFSVEKLQPALDKFKTIFEDVGIGITLDTTEVLSEDQFVTISTNFYDTTTAEMISKGASDVINLFFVEDLESSGRSVLGIAPGIPGSLGIAGKHNGTLIGLEAHAVGTELNISLLGETAAHEMGHFLGLFHTTESKAGFFDPIGDTPECPAIVVDIQNCLNYDSENLMFWVGDGDDNIEQVKLTEGQRHVIKYSPMAK